MKKMINVALDAYYQVLVNTSLHNERWRERNPV
jgi:hypothetical protein